MISAWTDERRALLAEMHLRGPKVIWEALNELPGPKLTKSAVIGLRDRKFMRRQPKKTPEEVAAMLLARRERANARVRVKRAKKAKKSTPKNIIYMTRIVSMNGNSNGQRVTMAPVAEPFNGRHADIVSRNLTILELQDGECRYPNDRDPPNAPIRFCGHSAVEDKPYCRAHLRIAYRPPELRSRGFSDIGKGRGGVFGRVA